MVLYITSNLRLLRSSSAPPAPSPSFAWRTELFSPPLVVFGVEEELLPVAAGMARQLRIFFCEFTQLIRRATEPPTPRRRARRAHEAQRGAGRRDHGAAVCPDAVTCACSRASGAPRGWRAHVAPTFTAVRHALTVEHTEGEARRASRFLLASCVCSATRTVTLAPSTSGRPTSEWTDVSTSGTWSSVITSPNTAASSRSALITSFTDTFYCAAPSATSANNVRADTTAEPRAPRSREATRPRRRGLRRHRRPPSAAVPPPAPSLRRPPSAPSGSGAPR